MGSNHKSFIFREGILEYNNAKLKYRDRQSNDNDVEYCSKKKFSCHWALIGSNNEIVTKGYGLVSMLR